MKHSTPPGESPQSFQQLFDAFASDYRRRSLLRMLSWALVGVLASFAVFVCADYWFELNYPLRVIAAALLLGGAVILIPALTLLRIRRSTESAIAAELENRFPELGQAVRTAIQYRDSAPVEGVSPALVSAMGRELAHRASALPLTHALERFNPRRGALVLGLFAAGMLLVAGSSWEWRLAAQRMLFGDEPFTRLTTASENTVEEGSALRISGTIQGRLRPAVLMTRPTDETDAPWMSREVSAAEETTRHDRLVEYEINLPSLKSPVEYRLVAGPYASDLHHVDVLHPLEIQSIRARVTPPAYTGAKAVEFERGTLRGLIGSRVLLTAIVDRPVREATLELVAFGVATDHQGKAAANAIPLKIDGLTLTGEFELTQDGAYSIVGRGVDGVRIRENRWRIRALHDQLPRLAFREPPLELEVHGLAEVTTHVDAHDDYGLKEAGIVIRLNNGQEYPLVTYSQSPKSGTTASNIQAVLEKVLPLESLQLSHRDSISYYAYAEDNSPGDSRRIESELRFIDVRPFRRTYRTPAEGGGGGGGRQLASLEQLVRRERWLLNQSLSLNRNVANGDRVNLNEVDDAISLQDETAALTRELADAALEVEAELEIAEDRISDLFYAAEEAMMRAVDAMSVSEFSTSHLQQVDAAASLVAARNAIELLIAQGGGAAIERLLCLDQQMQDRLRDRGEEERMQEAAARLRSLANRERRVTERLQELVHMAEEGATGKDTDVHAESVARQREVDDDQAKIVKEVEEIDQSLQELQTITELARVRSSGIIKETSAASSSIDAMQFLPAMASSRRATQRLRELAQHLEGIAPAEPSGRLATARDVAASLAMELRERAARTTDSDKTDKEIETDSGLTAEAIAQLSDSNATVNDVLDSIIASFQLQQDEVVPRLRRLMEDEEAARGAPLLEEVEALLLAERRGEARLGAEAAADRIEHLAHRLDAFHASLVAPRMAQLEALQQRAQELRAELANLGSQGEADRWRERVKGLLKDLDSLDVKLRIAPKLDDVIAAGGSWKVGNTGMLETPPEHVAAMDSLTKELQRYLQELAFGRVDASNVDATPPRYADFVKRYLELLSEEASQ